jgi:hypothetical protein
MEKHSLTLSVITRGVTDGTSKKALASSAVLVLSRDTLAVAGALSIAAATGFPLASSAVAAPAAELVAPSLIPSEAQHLKALTERLAKAPRRREFKTVPMILTNPEQWDYEALNEVLNYEPPFMLNAALNDIDAGMPNGQRYSCAS